MPQLEVISREPEDTAKETPILLVHGAWHGAWCWEEYFMPYFAEHGYHVHALSLRGHAGSTGGDVRWVSLSDYVDDVRGVATSFEQFPILIGHSMGGMVLQKYLQSASVYVPAAVMLAPAPFNGVLPMTARLLMRMPGAMLETVPSVSVDPLVSTPERVRQMFFSKALPDDELTRYTDQLQSESLRAILDMSFFDLPTPYHPDCPLLVLGAVYDALFPTREIQQTARVYGTEAEFFNVAHDMMLDVGWEAVAARIVTWLDAQNL